MFIATVQYRKLNLSDDSILTPSPCPGAPVYPDLASRLMDLTVLTFHTDEFIQTWPFCAWLLPLVSCLQAVCILWYVSVLCSLLSPNNILLPAYTVFCLSTHQLWKCCTQYVSKFGKLSCGHRTRKGQFSFQYQRTAMPKKLQTTTQLHSSHNSKIMLKIFQMRLQQYVNWELPNVQVGFRKGTGTRDQFANILWIIEKARKFQENIYFCFIDYAKAFDFVDHNKPWKILK